MTHPIERQVAIAMKPVIEGYRQFIETLNRAACATKLKPCPVCGELPTLDAPFTDAENTLSFRYYRCPGHVTGARRTDESMAARCWNAAVDSYEPPLKPCPVCGRTPFMEHGTLCNRWICSSGVGRDAVVHLVGPWKQPGCDVDAAWNAAVDAYEPKPCPVCGEQPIRRFDSIGQHRVACGDHLSTEPMDTKPGKTTVCTHNALKLDKLLEEHPNGIPVEKAAPLETVCEECLPSWIDRESRRLDAEDVAAWNAAVDAYEPPPCPDDIVSEAKRDLDAIVEAAQALRDGIDESPLDFAVLQGRLEQALYAAGIRVRVDHEIVEERNELRVKLDTARVSERRYESEREKLVKAIGYDSSMTGYGLVEYARALAANEAGYESDIDAICELVKPKDDETVPDAVKRAIEKVQRERDELRRTVDLLAKVRDDIAVAVGFQLIDTGSWTNDCVIAAVKRLAELPSAVDKLLVDIAGIDRIEKIKGLIGASVKLHAKEQAEGRYAERCAVLEQRLAAIRATADGKADA